MSTLVKVGLIIALVAAVVGAGFLGAQVAAVQRAAQAAPSIALSPAVVPAQPMPVGPGFRGQARPGPRGYNRDFRRDSANDEMMGSWSGQYRSQIRVATAEALGISLDDLDKALTAGKTPWQIAQEKNISLADFQEKMAGAMSEALKKAVASGDLTQAQADAMLAQMKDGVVPGLMGRGWGRGPDRHGHPRADRGRR